MQKTAILAVLISGLFFFGCLGNANSPAGSAQYSAYANNETGFSTLRPNEWAVTEKPGQVPLTTFKPAASGVSINIVSITTSSEINSQSLFSQMSARLALADQSSLISNVKLVGDSPSQLVIDSQAAERDAKKFSYTLDGKDAIGLYDMVLVKKGDRYIAASLVASCYPSGAASCDQLNSNYEQIFGKVIENLKFI
jgi:hypothetical protein